MLENCFLMSFLILLISGICCAVWNLVIHFKRLSKLPVVNPINVFSVFTFIAFLILFIPNAFLEYKSNVFLALLSAFFDSMDSLSFGNRIEDMIERFFINYADVPNECIFYACTVTLMVPVFAMRTVFVIFRDMFTQIRFTFNHKNSFHIFSELNDKSIIVAKDIIKKDKRAKIIFTSINKKLTNNLYIEQARKINALLTNKTLNGFRVSDVFSDKKLYLYFIGEDGKNNIKLALDKFEDMKNSRLETTVYVFSTDYTVERVVDLANSRKSNSKIKMELFNSAQRTAYNLMNEHPIYDVESDDETINVMILGAGHIGLEIAKAIAWCSQMINRQFSIRIFDKDRKNEKFGFPFNNLTEKLGEIGTTVNIEFFNCDIFSDKFDNLRFERADYITIDIGDDSENLAAALQMREVYARQKNEGAYAPSDIPSPKIITIIEDEETKKIVQALDDPMIIPYGAMCDVFNLDNIIDWEIDKVGEFLHACYNSFVYIKANQGKNIDYPWLINQGIDSYATQSELNKRSSRAAAIHNKYKFFDMGIDGVGDQLFTNEIENIFKNNNESMLRCEHNRWNVFQVLDGWQTWDKNRLLKGKHKDNSSKLHAYLADFNDLKSIAKYIYGESEDPIAYDQIVISSSRLAFDYAKKGYVDNEKLEQLFTLFERYIKENNYEKIQS